MITAVRQWLNLNSAVVTALAVVLLIISLGIVVLQIMNQSHPYRMPELDVYYYDMNTGKLFTGSNMLVPPIEAPSGPGPNGVPSGFSAHVFACGECPEDLSGRTAEELYKDKLFIGWLEMYTPEAQARIKAIRDGTLDPNDAALLSPDEESAGQLIRAFDSDQWLLADSEEAIQIMYNMGDVCGKDTPPKHCLPPQD